MSIINEALKKTQEKLKRTGTFPSNNPSAVPPQSIPGSLLTEGQKKNNLTTWMALLLIAIGFIGCLAFFFVLPKNQVRITPLKGEMMRAATMTPPASSTRPTSPRGEQGGSPAPVAANPPATEPVVPPAPSKPSLVLNGTIIMGNDKSALINNQIYKVGDDVEGKRIVDIFFDRVELSDGENMITITTKQK